MIKPINLMKKITSNRKFKAENPVNRISKGISTRFFQFSLILTILATSILGYGQQAQQLQMSDFVLFSGDGGPGTSSCSSPGYAVQLSSSTTVTGGAIGSFKLVQTTGTSSINGDIFSKGTITLANSNSVSGKIAAANLFNSTGNILSIGSNANLGGNIDVKGNIYVGGGTVLGKVTHPSGTTYTGPTPVGGNITSTPSLPIFPSLPVITSFPPYPQMADITKTTTITPGGYDDIKLSGNQTLTFKGTGVYIIDLIDNKAADSP